MKKIALITLTILSLHQLAVAQIQKEDVAIAQSLFSKQKKEIISKYMKVLPDDRAFWTLYDEYEVKRKLIMEDRFYLLKEYSEKYATLNDATAARLAHGFMDASSKTDQLNRQYFKKFEKQFGGLLATTLFQLEMYIQTATQANLQSQIPIIGELQKLSELQSGVAGF